MDRFFSRIFGEKSKGLRPWHRALSSLPVLAVVAVVSAPDPALAQGDDLFLGPDVVREEAAVAGQVGEPASTPSADDGDAVQGVRQARGLVEAGAEAVLSSEIAGRLVDLPVEEGDRFAADDTLIAFDCALYEARLREAEASALAARRQLANDRQLARHNSIGALEVALSEAALLEAEAAVEVASVFVDRCTVAAPYAGVMVQHLVHAQESVSQGEDLVSIVAADGAVIDLIVPSRWLRWLKPGASFAFLVDELGSDHRAEVTRLGARIDPVSQTIRVTGRFLETPPQVIPGMSGTAVFEAPTGAAAAPEG